MFISVFVLIVMFRCCLSFPSIADPPVISGAGDPLCQQLLFNVSFTSFTPHNFSIAAPSCMSKNLSSVRVLLSLICNVTQGRQYDRTVTVWMGGVLLLAGTTSEPRKNLSPSWQVSADISDHLQLLQSNQIWNGQVRGKSLFFYFFVAL